MSFDAVVRVLAGTVVISALCQAVVTGRHGTLPSSLFPDVRLSGTEVRDLYHGKIIVKVLDSQAASELVVFAGSRIDVSPQRFVDAIRHSARLWRAANIPRSGTFGTPVRLADIAEMRLPPDDLDALGKCQPGDCDVKLTRPEISRLRAVVKRTPGERRSTAQREFRLVILDRIHTYIRAGLPGLSPFHDQEPPIDPDRAFTGLLSSAQIVSERVQGLIGYLKHYPHQPLPDGAEDHLYWLETVHPPRPTIQASHVVISRSTGKEPIEVAVVSRQVFATHYMNASLAATVLVRTRSGERFLLYLNRTSADDLGGVFSGVKRFFVKRRVRSGAHEAFLHLKKHIESYPGQP